MPRLNEKQYKITMGFKEVMALRQEGQLDDALKLAKEDYKAQTDQWSASALFWVLKDIATKLIEENRPEEATPMVNQMEQLVGEMGATVNVATETVEQLQKQVVPHYLEIEELLATLKRLKQFLPLEEGFLKVQEWYQSDEGLHSSLHESYANIMLLYLQRKGDELIPEEFEEYMTHYFSLENPRPSKVHSKYLQLLLTAKNHFESGMKLREYVEKWDLTNLRPEDWKHKKKPNTPPSERKPLAVETLKLLVSELFSEHQAGSEVTVPQHLYQMLIDALTLYPEEEVLLHTKARLNVIDGDLEKAIENYEEILIHTEEPQAWYEYALLTDSLEIRAAALAKALQMEENNYLDFVNLARIELADCLIQQELLPNALRELDMYAQICLEKGREPEPRYKELKDKIPGTIEADKENKDFYFRHSRPAEEHIYAELPETTMIVADVIAMRLQSSQKLIVPMLKLMTAEGKTALVTTKMYGVAEGDNRGLVYEAKLLERKYAYTKVVLLTPSDKGPKEVFPTVVARINGYSEATHAHHLMDNNNRHHYLPGAERNWEFGEFLSVIVLQEHLRPKKGSKQAPSIREYLLLPERLNPMEAVRHFPAEVCLVIDVRDGEVELLTEEGNRGTAPISISDIPLLQGDRVLARGFTQRHKNRRTGEIAFSFNPLQITDYREEE